MSNEYNNDNNTNSSGEYPVENRYNNNSQYSNNNLNHTNSHRTDNNNYSGNYYPYNTNNTEYGYQSNYEAAKADTAPLLNGKNEKPKKKRGLFGVVKLTAAAIAFGLIAGAVFQGYQVLTKPENEVVSEKENVNETEQADTKDQTDVIEQNNNTDSSVMVPTSSTSDGVVTDVSDVVEKVMPSIVAINSSGTATRSDFFGRQFNEPIAGSGSGIIIDQNGSEILIVTNNHVIQNADKVEIVFMDETTAQATVKGADANADLAVLSVSMSDLSEDTLSAIKVAALGNSDEVKAGEMAIAIGNALGYGQSVTVGYISAVNREVTIDNVSMTLLQTDAAINPGNSGGALINANGEVIGINSVKYASEEVEGMGYAIPITNAVPMINELMNREKIEESEQGFLGIYVDTAQNVTEVYAERFNMPIGVYIGDVVEDSPAAVAGLKQGHIITKVNDNAVKTIDGLLNTLSYHRAGETITLTVNVLDNGEYVEKNLSVTLGER